LKYLALACVLAALGFTAVALHGYTAVGPEIGKSQATQVNVYDLTVKAGNLPDATVAAAF
jgi:hypothetical protein